jgi:3,5-epimerase/4-reductase
LFGGKGWIGQQVVELLEKREGDTVIVTDVRADNETAVLQLIEKVKPDRVMSFIGRTHGPGCNTIDYLEQKGKLYENIRDNMYGPLVLARICEQHNIHYTYLGTGCIFSGDEQYHEEMRPNFFGSSYSIVKGFTDRLMHMFPNTTLNVRIRMPIVEYAHPRNFITKIIGYPNICNSPNSVTVLPELLPLMVDMAVRKHVGSINLTNPGTISHNEILEMYKQYGDPSHTWNNVTIEVHDGMLASKRSCCHLDTSLLQALYPHVTDAKTAVEKIMQNYK